MSEPYRAVLFDIDGTILVTGGAGGAAWKRAFEEQCGVEADVAEHTDAGMTDPEIAAISGSVMPASVCSATFTSTP